MKSSDRTILTINGGSSSIKFALFAGNCPLKALLRGGMERIGLPGATLSLKGSIPINNLSRAVTASDHNAALNSLMDCIEEHSQNHDLTAIGHRVVQGGPKQQPANNRPRIDPGTAATKPVRSGASSGRKPLHRDASTALLSCPKWPVSKRLSPRPAACSPDIANPAPLRSLRDTVRPISWV
jgi:hypothetical protein